jgi:L-fuculose-phosphate aldolase
VNAIVHLHPQLSVLLAALGHQITLLTSDHLNYLREVVVRPFAHPGTAELARDAAQAVAGGANAVVLGHHGCSVLADSVELAHKRAFNLEEAARTTALGLLLTGGAEVPPCPPDYLRALLSGTATV